jgi:hypothetical protein
MIRSLYYQNGGEIHTQLAIEDFKPALENAEGYYGRF